MGMMFVTDVTSFYIARVLLGVAEAGFFPGMVLYLTYWIPAADRARTGALFMMAAPIAVIVGAPVSEALLLPARLGRAPRLAVAVRRRRLSRGGPRHSGVASAHRQAGAGDLAASRMNATG